MEHIDVFVNKIIKTNKNKDQRYSNPVIAHYEDMDPKQQRYWQMGKRRLRHTIKLPINREFSDDPIKFINDNRWEKKMALIPVLAYLLRLCNRYGGNIYMSQQKMARHIGFTFKTINKWIGYLSRYGIIKKENRGPTSCNITLSDYFKTSSACKALSFLFPILLTMASSSSCCEGGKGYTINRDIYRINNNTTTICKVTQLEDRFLSEKERFKRKCEAGREKNRRDMEEILNNSLKGGVCDSHTSTESPPVTVYKRIPTIMDIPKKQLDKMHEKYPKEKHKGVIDRLLQAIMLIWEHEYNECIKK